MKDKDVRMATDPHQYDSPELDWRIGGAENDASRVYFREALDSIVTPDILQEKRVLDIGSGTGQLFNWLRSKGVSEVVGIDPSLRNIETSTKMYPWATSLEATLEEFASKNSKKFDVALCCTPCRKKPNFLSPTVF